MSSVYPSQYQLPELTAHLVALLERRRAAFDVWDEKTEAALTEAAQEALVEAGKQFKELAADAPYWQRTTEALLEVALPRYFRLAKEQHALEKRGYGAWRGGDFISRAAFAGIGLVVGFIILRTAVPDWLEPLPLAMFIGGPLIPDAQAFFAKRKYSKQLLTLVEDMKAEASDRRTYQPLGVDEGAVTDSTPPQKSSNSVKG
ncbi:MAG: hypothetical protein GQE15_18825 [Archangiaceae bacterium]|nr:hypothetical protein [Archangiaceae bacterium]